MQNKPVTITEKQATAIESNNEKRSYPQVDEEKLSGIEENATIGADWETNLLNIPELLVKFLQKLEEEGVTKFDIAPDGKTLRLGNDD